MHHYSNRIYCYSENYWVAGSPGCTGLSVKPVSPTRSRESWYPLLVGTPQGSFYQLGGKLMTIRQIPRLTK